jgi:hypothetical protein
MKIQWIRDPRYRSQEYHDLYVDGREVGCFWYPNEFEGGYSTFIGGNTTIQVKSEEEAKALCLAAYALNQA